MRWLVDRSQLAVAAAALFSLAGIPSESNGGKSAYFSAAFRFRVCKHPGKALSGLCYTGRENAGGNGFAD